MNGTHRLPDALAPLINVRRGAEGDTPTPNVTKCTRIAICKMSDAHGSSRRRTAPEFRIVVVVNARAGLSVAKLSCKRCLQTSQQTYICLCLFASRRSPHPCLQTRRACKDANSLQRFLRVSFPWTAQSAPSKVSSSFLRFPAALKLGAAGESRLMGFFSVTASSHCLAEALANSCWSTRRLP